MYPRHKDEEPECNNGAMQDGAWHRCFSDISRRLERIEKSEQTAKSEKK